MLDALREAVVRDPDADAPREVLADALLEAGDPRGEFIRVQLGRERDPANLELAARERAILDEHGAAFVEGLPPGRYLFRRGGIARAHLSERDWIAADELRGREPLAELEVFYPRDEFFHVAPLGGLRELELLVEDSISLSAVNALAARLPPGFRLGMLANQRDAPELVRRLAVAPLGSLGIASATEPLAIATTLLESNIPTIRFQLRLAAGDVEALAANPAIGRRGVLALDDCDIDAVGVRTLAASPHLAGLRELTLDSFIGNDGSLALAAAPFAATLEKLHLRPRDLDGYHESPNPLRWMDSDGVVALLHGAFPRLRELTIGVPDGSMLVNGPLLDQLETLEVHGARPARGPRLRRLSLRNVHVSEDERVRWRAQLGALAEFGEPWRPWVAVRP